MTARAGRPPRECSVAGCQRRHYGRGYCRTHWTRWHRHGDPEAPLRRRNRLCGVEGCDRRHSGRGLCAAHLARLTRYGNVQADVPVGRRGGPRRTPRLCEVPGCGRRHLGRGYCRTHLSRLARAGDVRADVPIDHHTRDGLSYWSVHHRLINQRGPATAQRCADCGAGARCWSYDGNDPDDRISPAGYRYSPDLDRYQPRCQPCHRRATIARNTPQAAAAVEDAEQAIWLYERGVSAPGIAAIMAVSRTAVYTALRAHGVIIRPRGSRAPLVAHPADDTGGQL